MKGFHVFFDLDRTLWDFERNSKQALLTLHSELGVIELIPNFYDFLNTYQRINNDLWIDYGKKKISKEALRIERFKQTLQKFNVFDLDLAERLNQGYIEISPNLTHTFPGALEVLKELKKSEYKIHIITNGFKEVQYHKIDNCGFSPYLDVILCSEDVGVNKPHPDIFHYALTKAIAKPEKSVMIGDDLHVDYHGALQAGLHAILFDPQQVRRKRNQDFHVADLRDIPKILPFVFKGIGI